MSHRHDTSLIANAYVFGVGGLGVLGSAIPSDGDHGAGYAYNDLTLPADANKEIRGEILTVPSSGSFFAYEDTSFELDGAVDGTYTFSYRLYVDGADLGTATATIVVGVVNGLATASIVAITLTPPNATATGTTGVVDGFASASLSSIGLLAPSATAAATANATAFALLAPLGLAAPSATALGTASGDAIAVASLHNISLSAPAAFATGSAVVDAIATAAIRALTLSAPTAYAWSIPPSASVAVKSDTSVVTTSCRVKSPITVKVVS